MQDQDKQDLDEQCLDAFPRWLGSLGSDASSLTAWVGAEQLPTEARTLLVGALTYLVKSLDLIPDGVEDLGFIDDAFILRVASALALQAVPETDRDALDAIAALARDASLIESYLGHQYARLERFVSRLGELSARGRSVEDVMNDAEPRAALVSEVQAWAQSYEVPAFRRDTRSLIKLSAFLDTKLPA